MTAGTVPASVTSVEPSAAASDPVTAAAPSPARSFEEELEDIFNRSQRDVEEAMEEILATPRPQVAVSAGTPRRAQEVSPGSGQAAASPGSGAQSPASWTSRSPGTPSKIRERIFKDYQPASELLETYVARVQRQAMALFSLGDPLEEGAVAAVLAKAAYELRLYEEANGDPARQLRILTREFVFELLEIDGSEAQAGRLGTLEMMLAERGADIADIKTKAATGQPVAITPETVQATKPLVFGPKRGGEPSLAPAAPAGFQTYNIFGTGPPTPRRNYRRCVPARRDGDGRSG